MANKVRCCSFKFTTVLFHAHEVVYLKSCRKNETRAAPAPLPSPGETASGTHIATAVAEHTPSGGTTKRRRRWAPVRDAPLRFVIWSIVQAHNRSKLEQPAHLPEFSVKPSVATGTYKFVSSCLIVRGRLTTIPVISLLSYNVSSPYSSMTVPRRHAS